MPSITEVINQLNAYEKVADIFAAETALTQLVSAANPDEKLFENARKELRLLLKRADVKIGKHTLAAVVHACLIALAELKPVNDTDPITLEKIEAWDSVVVSTGQQFSLESLVGYHNGRRYKDNHLNEFANSKWLLNPLNNEPFDTMDVEHIQKMVLKRQEQLIDNAVMNHDIFDNLSLSEKVASIRSQMRLDNLRTSAAPVIADEPHVPRQVSDSLVVRAARYGHAELIAILAHLRRDVVILNLGNMENQADRAERHRFFGAIPEVPPANEAPAPAAPSLNPGSYDEDDMYG